MTRREEELAQKGWEKRFIAEEPRFLEMREMYESIGFDVLLEPLPPKEELAACVEGGCTACLELDRRGTELFTRGGGKIRRGALRVAYLNKSFHAFCASVRGSFCPASSLKRK